jgi:pimeloyl-ACP methyl ester carboxylesterase
LIYTRGVRALLVVTFAPAALLAACAPPVVTAPYEPTVTFGPCDARSVMTGVAEDEGGAECGVLEVPVDWSKVDDVDTARLTLDVARIPANAPGERRGVLTFDFGGPGIPAVTRLASLDGRAGLAGEALDLVDAFDRVALNRRGTQLGCVDRALEVALVDVPRAPGDDDEWDAVFAVERAIAAHCEEVAGADVLAHLDIESAARDLEALRQALDEPVLHILASSEGTRSAAAYATLFPSTTGAVVLDSPALAVDDAERHLREQADGFEQALARFFAWCAQRPLEECPLHVDGSGSADEVAASFDSLVTLLDTFPIEARGVRVDGGFVLDLVVDASFAPDKMWGALGDVLGRAITSGDFGAIASLAARVDPDLDEGAFRAITAIDRPFPRAEYSVRALADELAATGAPRVGRRVMRGEVGNTLWPVRAARPAMTIGPARDAPPFLIIAGAFDGATPIAWAEEMRDTLDNNSALLVYEGDGHTRAPDVECLGRAAVEHFLAWPDVARVALERAGTCASVDP